MASRPGGVIREGGEQAVGVQHRPDDAVVQDVAAVVLRGVDGMPGRQPLGGPQGGHAVALRGERR